MKVVYTDEALRDLDGILTFIGLNYPSASVGFQRRLRAIEWRIGRWPESGQQIEQRERVRVVTFTRFPYKIFYRATEREVQVLHIHHAARAAGLDD